ncbi:MAG: cupin domain-containing protein [Opitutales bacterium]
MLSPGSQERIATLVRSLRLEPLPGEQGRFNVLFRSKLQVAFAGSEMPACNALYYLLTADDPRNHLHWLACDDTEMLLEGGPYQRFAFHSDGTVIRQHVGQDLVNNQRPIFHAPGGSWKAARLDPGADFALIGSVVAPAWTPDRVRIGGGPKFLQRFTGKAHWATEPFLRECIGPNWREDL